MPSVQPPLFDPAAFKLDPDNFDVWESLWHDYAMLSGYRDATKPRSSEADHYAADKRPIELAALRCSIPTSEWKTLRKAIAASLPVADQPLPWKWFPALRAHYAPRNQELHEHLRFYTQVAQAPGMSMADWGSEVQLAAARCSFPQDNDNDHILRDLFLVRMHSAHSRFKEDILYASAQRAAGSKLITFPDLVAKACAYEAASRKLPDPLSPSDQPVLAVAQARRPATPLASAVQTQGPRRQCRYCGGPGAHPRTRRCPQCPARDATCSYCGRIGHFTALCEQRLAASSSQPPRDRGPRRQQPPRRQPLHAIAAGQGPTYPPLGYDVTTDHQQADYGPAQGNDHAADYAEPL